MGMEEKIKKELNQLNTEKTEEILESFTNFKQYLAEKVSKGESLGLSDEQLAKTTEIAANYLAKHEEPRNREEKVLKELWKAGSKEEQHTLAHMLLKMVREA
ncbi:DUF3243 domain-containing protein [Filibacter tadaridae]|uniref:DUF3243 domain-containing protein n=1 Tax=Filibacter tadaridae TaxID=2483811 RepID=A0A3P5X1K8_9BACL|nr:DUF3243 domain-containing protein [Filibacter tadaridae]VDC21084.1 hypothetical protein FILTAD_00558 [Filibacter tadaridae]